MKRLLASSLHDLKLALAQKKPATISAGATAPGGHYRIYSLGGFHQLKQCQRSETEITVSWAQRTPAGQLLAVTRRKGLWFSTKTKHNPLSGRKATSSLVSTCQESVRSWATKYGLSPEIRKIANRETNLCIYFSK